MGFAPPAAPPPPAVGGGGTGSGGKAEKTFASASSHFGQVRVSRTRFATRGPAARRGTRITVRLARPATIELVVRRAGPSCTVVAKKTVQGRRGVNRVPFSGRVRHHPLAPGTYTITVVAVRGSSRKRLGMIPVQVVPPGRVRQGGAPPRVALCASRSGPAAASLFALPAAIVQATEGPGGKGHALALRPPHVKPPGGILGSGIRTPHISVPNAPGGFDWVMVLIILTLGLPLVFIVVFTVRLLRRSAWSS